MSSPLEALGGLAGALLASSRTRLELLGEEVRLERGRLLCLLAALFTAVMFLLLALLVASVALALYVWPDERRYLALGLLALLYAVLGAVAGGWLLFRLRHDPPPLQATLDVLGDDLKAVRRARSGPAAVPDDVAPGDPS